MVQRPIRIVLKVFLVRAPRKKTPNPKPVHGKEFFEAAQEPARIVYSEVSTQAIAIAMTVFDTLKVIVLKRLDLTILSMLSLLSFIKRVAHQTGDRMKISRKSF